MDITKVDNETYLAKEGDYLRLNSDARILMHGRTGEYFALASGEPWPHGMYHRHGERGPNAKEVLPLGAYGDLNTAAVREHYYPQKNAA